MDVFLPRARSVGFALVGGVMLAACANLSGLSGGNDASTDTGLIRRDAGHDASSRSVVEASADRASPTEASSRSVDAGAQDATPRAGDAGSGKVAIVGSVCAQPAATACQGNDSSVVLICQSGVWTASTTCSASQRCDSTVGACADVAPMCAGLSPGSRVCSSGNLLECGPDLVTTSVVQACGARQTCVTADGGAACVCNASAGCTTAGATSCASGSLVTCTSDGDGCLYPVTTPCTNGACFAADAGATCCTNAAECTASKTTCQSGSASCHACTANTFTTCTTGANGCLQIVNSAPCSIDNPVCVGSQCGCASASDCVHSPAGRSCGVDAVCGCETAADCPDAGCCDLQVGGGPTCTPSGGTFDGDPCFDGIFP